MLPSLSKLVLRLQDHATDDLDAEEDDPDEWAVQDLLGLLRSQPTLEDLAMEFYETGSFKFDGADNSVLELPSVKSFSLHWHGNTDIDGVTDYQSSTIPRLLELLDMRNVEVFRFRIQRETFEYHEDALPCELPLLLNKHLKFFLRDNGYFPRLESFYLKFYSTEKECLHLPASYIQNIKHLSLDINTKLLFEIYTYYISDLPPLLPNLRTLTLRNCDRLDISSIMTIFNAESFQHLVIDDCRYISEPWASAQLRKIAGPGKITVYPLKRISRHYYH